MIYKFRKDEQECVLEVENVSENNVIGIVQFTIIKQGREEAIDLHKEDVFKLIGALHLLHKEMK